MKPRYSLVVWCRGREKIEGGENVFLKLLLIFFVNMEKLFMADLLSNELYEKIIVCSICCITKSRLSVQFVKKIPLEMVIGQEMKEEGMIKINNGFYIKLSIHLLLKQGL